MPDFAYHVINPSGQEKHGRITADNNDDARSRLERKQLYVVKISPARGENKQAQQGLNFSFGQKKLNQKQLTLFTRQLSSLTQVSPLEESLRTISRQSEKEHVRDILNQTHAYVLEGQRLSEAMRKRPKSFPPLYTAMIAAGETSGALPEIMERLANLMERQAEIRSKLISALVYPIVLTIVAILVVAGLMISVVPRIVEQFDDIATLPPLTRAVMAISSFLASYWWAILAVLVIMITAFVFGLRNENFRYRVDSLLLKSPFIGKLIRNLNAARMARTLSTMVASRLPLLEGLKLTRSVIPNRVLRAANDDMVENVRSGGSLSGAMRSATIFPPILVYLAASGETAGQLDSMLARAADYLEREFDNFTSTLLSLLEPLIIVIMGGIVALIILSILLPILQLQNLTGI